MTPCLCLDCAKAIYRNAVGPRVTDTESAAWWDDADDGLLALGDVLVVFGTYE